MTETEPGRIEIIFFDLGGVLVNVHKDKLIENLTAISKLSETALFRQMNECYDDFLLFEKGLIDSRAFFQQISTRFETNLDYHTFCDAYVNIFDLNKATLGLAQQLLPNVQLSIISNTDELHYNYIMEQYSDLEIFHQPTTSFEAHSLKPEKDIYYSAMNKFNVSAQNCLFIDDLAENVEGAKKVGMHGIHYKTTSSLKNELQKNGFFRDEY